MKNLIALLILALVGNVAFAQYDQKALEVLDAMSAKYKSMSGFKADFKTSMINEVDGINEEFGGKVVVKGDMYKLEMDDQIVINDGNTVWTYLPDVNEVNIDTYDPAEDEISPSKIYNAYKEGFKYIYLGEEKRNGETVSVIDLVPENKDAQFFKIKLFIDVKGSNLKSWIMFDKTGNKYTYTFDNLKTNINPDDSTFKFDATKYPGVEVIDLR